MAIEKINFSYPKGSLQTVYDTEATTALELASLTSAKVDECVELVNGVEQTATESRNIVDTMRTQQEQFVTENNDTRQAIITENQAYIDSLEASKTQLETDLDTELTNYKASLNTSKTTFETDMTTSLNTFKSELTTSKTTFETDMTNTVNTIKDNANAEINADVDAKINTLIDDGTIEGLINQQILTDVRGDITTLETDMASVKTFKDKSNLVEINVLAPPASLTSAKGDGVTDDTTTIQNIINYANSVGGAVITFPSGKYKITNTLPLYSNIHINLSPSAIIDASTAPVSTPLFQGVGVENGGVSLTVSAVKGNKSVSISTGAETAFKVGDLVKIASEDIFDPGRTNQRLGELAIVASVSSGSITFNTPLADSYNTTDSAFIAKLDPIINASIVGGKILGGGVGKLHVGFRVDVGYHIRVNDTQFQNFEEKSMYFGNCLDVLVDGVNVKSSSASGTGYGVFFGWACQDSSVVNSWFYDCRHAVTTGGGPSNRGVCRRITYQNNCVFYSSGTGDAMDTHSASDNISFLYNKIYSSGGVGISVECPSVSIIGNEIYFSTNHGIYVNNCSARASEYKISGNKIMNAGAMGIRYANNASVAGAGSLINFVTIENNEIYKCVGVGIYAITTDTWRISNIKIVNNTIIEGSGASAIQLQKADIANVSGNLINKLLNTSMGLKLSDITKSNIENNVIMHTSLNTGKGIYIETSADLQIIGNITSTSAVALTLDNLTTYCIVKGNNFRGCTTPISRGAGTGHILSSADASGAYNII